MNKPNAIYINGCSWTYGDGLENPEQENFSVNLKKIYGADECINDSQRGGSNDRIARTTINFLLANKDHWDDLLVVIGWSCPHRTEFWSDMQSEWEWINQYRQGERSEKGLKARAYYGTIWNETQAFTNYYMNVITLQSFFKANNIKYFMFRSFGFQNPMTNLQYGGDADWNLYNSLVNKGNIPDTYVDSIDTEYFESFVKFENTWHSIIKKNVRHDGRTFNEHYPVHPDKQEHIIFSEWLNKKLHTTFKWEK
jgi:hypothetical protein